MTAFFHDLRYAVRLFGRAPGFTAVAVLTLGLSLGANTAAFSVARAVLLDPLPYHDAERLVGVWEDMSRAGSFPTNTPAAGNYADWKAQNTVFESMAALRSTALNLTGEGPPERLSGRRVTHDFFAVLGVEPLVGRVFTAGEDRPGGADVALVGYGLWQTRFGGSPELVGRTILLDGTPHTVIGVMPPGFDYPERGTQVWTPIAFTPEQLANRGSHYLQVIARLRSGVTLESARTEMKAIALRLEQQYPETNANVSVGVYSLRDQIVGDTCMGLILLMAIVGCVLLVASANLANLLLSRATERRKEFAVRIALGAGQGRLARQLLAENLLLSGAGAVPGVVLAAWSFNGLAILIPQNLTSARLSVDGSLVACSLVLGVLATILFGGFPVRLAWRVGFAEMLRQGDGRAGESRATRRVRTGLIVSQMAFAVLLLVAAGLILRTFANLRAIDPGFRGDGVLTLRTSLPQPGYDDVSRRTTFYREVVERVAALPGVSSAGFVSWLPYTNWGGAQDVIIEGRPTPKPGETNDANIRLVTSGYFPAMGMTLVGGRFVTDADGADGAERVAVINETMARRFWPAADALTGRFRLCAQCPSMRIVGITGDMHQLALNVDVRPEFYVPYAEPLARALRTFAMPQDLAIRTSADPTTLVAPVREAIWAVDPEQPIAQVRVMSEYRETDLAPHRFQALLLGGFAGLAVLLASLGIYGVLSYTVAQRRREIGLRVALGAQPPDVIRLFVWQGLWPALAGVAIGLTVALATAHLIASLLHGVEPNDVVTFAAATGILLAVATFACYVPARRATRVDPIVALRYE